MLQSFSTRSTIMARDVNRVQCTGYLGADPELRYTAQGTLLATFRVASGRVYRDTDGERQEETEWFRVAAWDRLAEQCATLLTTGSRVYIEGRLQTRRWVDAEGRERSTVEVVAHDMILLSSRERAVETPAEERPTLDARTETATVAATDDPSHDAGPPPPKRRSRRTPAVEVVAP
jgi:single-strand DNA-binding protein